MQLPEARLPVNAGIVVLAWNGADQIGACLEAVLACEGEPSDIIVVDNGSTDDSREVAKLAAPMAKLLALPENLGFAGGMNAGLDDFLGREHAPEVLILLNQDTAVDRGWYQAITAPFGTAADIGVVGCKIYYPDGKTLQHAGASIEPARAITTHIGAGETDAGRYDVARDCEYVTGAAMAVRSAALRKTGPLDAGFFPAYYEEVDLCLRMRDAGYRVRYEPSATLRHAESTSLPENFRRYAVAHRNRLRFVVKNYTWPDLWETFLPAERAHAAAIGHDLELATLRQAYLGAILGMEEWIIARRTRHEVSDEQAAELRSLFGDLRREIARDDPSRPWW
ncbi:MAG: glycosyltransferase family 2 protein [Deltaproteobacteria bacterium]